MFLDDATGRIHTGDLFYGWQIRGVPLHNDGEPVTVAVLPELVIAGADYTTTRGRFADTETGLRLVGCSQSFREHVARYFPALRRLLPGGE